MGITEQDLQPLKKIKVPPEYENDAQFYLEAVMRQHERRRQRLLSEYQELLNFKPNETSSAQKSQIQDEKSEDVTNSRINDKLIKIKKIQQEYRQQQLEQYSQKEQLIESRRKQISSERELKAFQKEVLETSRYEQVQRNRENLQKMIVDKQVRRRMSYDAKLQKWELFRQAQYMQPKSNRFDEALARYQKSVEDRKQLDQQRLRRLEVSLEKANTKKIQNIVEIKRRGLLEQLKIEEALFNRERSQQAKKSRLLDKLQLRTELVKPLQMEQIKQKSYPFPKFLCSKEQKRLNSQAIDHFCQEIVQTVETTNIHELEDKLLQVCATQDKVQKELYAKTNYLFLYN